MLPLKSTSSCLKSLILSSSFKIDGRPEPDVSQLDQRDSTAIMRGQKLSSSYPYIIFQWQGIR